MGLRPIFVLDVIPEPDLYYLPCKGAEGECFPNTSSRGALHS